jgi:hypothetical protein
MGGFSVPFIETQPVRWFLMFRAVFCLAAALALPLLLLEGEGDTTRTIFVLVGAGVVGLIGALYLRAWRRAAPAPDAKPLTHMPASLQVERIRRALWLSVPAFSVLTAIIVNDLNSLESGERANLYAPVALIYNHLGYWPAVLVAPLGGIILIGVGLYKLRKLRSGAR